MQWFQIWYNIHCTLKQWVCLNRNSFILNSQNALSILKRSYFTWFSHHIMLNFTWISHHIMLNWANKSCVIHVYRAFNWVLLWLSINFVLKEFNVKITYLFIWSYTCIYIGVTYKHWLTMITNFQNKKRSIIITC